MHLYDDPAPGRARRFVQIWPSAATGEWVSRSGTVGKAAPVTEIGLAPDDVEIAALAAPYLAEGFVEWQDTSRDVVVAQWPSNDKRYDLRLVERAHDWVAQLLDERGLGYVDGHDRGKQLDGKPPMVVNVFCYVLPGAGELGAVALMAGLRKAGADATRATIVHRPDDETTDWAVRYERTAYRFDGPFSL